MKWRFIALAVLAGLTAVALIWWQSAATRGDGPNPALSPQQVVILQLEALRTNGPNDHGIAKVFRFASPSNRFATGPLERFAMMLKHGPYAMMIGCESYELKGARISGDRAEQMVSVHGFDQRPATYVFLLSKQNAEPYQDCWMTDAVHAIPIEQVPDVTDGGAGEARPEAI